MGEKVVLSHYISPDFSPNYNIKKSKVKNGQIQIRWMLPFSVKCSNCGDIMMQGTKIGAKKEICYGEDYLGITVYRLYVHCKACYAEILIKTDPKNSDYHLEAGGTRHFEPWRDCNLKVSEEEDGEEEYKRRVANQIEELEELDLKHRHRRKPKLSDLKKIHSSGLVDDNLTPIDRGKIRSFVSKKHKYMSSDDEKEIKLEKTRDLGFFGSDEF